MITISDRVARCTRFLLALALSHAVLIASGGALAQDEQTAGYTYLNELRVRSGMIEFQRNADLEEAAQGHSDYLVGNSTSSIRFSGHFQNPGNPLFTGNSVSDRTAAAGYLSTLVGENVSAGQDDIHESIDGLMGAIYHRFGFLSFDKDEVGLGFVRDSSISWSAYTYNMGNAALNGLCSGSSFSGSGSFFQSICAQDSSFRVAADDKRLAEENVQGQNPFIVAWPVQGDDDVPPAFFEESPDPLPDLSVSGYPVSLQFNPLSYTEVTINSFRIFDDVTNEEISNTRLLDVNTDPNFNFSNLEFALFPIERLQWKHAYRAEVDYTSNLESDTLVWKFATRSPGAPVFEYAGDGQTVEIPVNVVNDFVFYIPPEDGSPTIGSISFSFPGGVIVETSFIDGNTLAISMNASVGQQVNFSTSSRSFSLLVGNAAEIPADPVFDLSVDDSDNNGSDTVPVSYDPTTQILSIPRLIVDGGAEHSITLRLLDESALTFAVDSVGEVNSLASESVSFSTSTLVLDIPRLEALGAIYSVQMTLTDLENQVLQLTSAVEVPN